MFAGKKSAQIREILISESAWEEMTCLFAPSLEDLYPDEGSKYIDKMVDKVASVAIPIAVHQKCSETYGGRNNRKVETESGEMITKKELDARDLEAAVNANWDANAECLKNEYGMSNEKIEEIRAKLHKLNRNVGLY
ncbi:S-type Pyocin family protein [Klebsiella pneumoniae]|nr:S-type Pyocin family protein [Klebsiella pneumoniae]